MNRQPHTLIIGASVAGLASAAALQRRGIDYAIIEKQDLVATPWRTHYERLHLHTSKRFSNLPYQKFGRSVPRYPSRQQVIDYLEDYRQTFHIDPVFHTEAISAQRRDRHWITATNNGSFHSNCLIMATGVYDRPRPIDFKGIRTFPGRVLHSSEYKTGKIFSGQKVLVVGFGNSACEIAIDLYEQGAAPVLSVRSPVNVVPRDVLGIPVLQLSYLLSALPPHAADILSAPLMRWLVGDITRLGLHPRSYGPLESIRRDGLPPVLDIGTIRHIREGHIGVRPGIDHIEGQTLHFKDGRCETFDAIIACIGYYPGHAGIVHVDKNRFIDARLPPGKQKFFGADGLYFCGFWISPTGQIRAIASDAQKIAAHIAGGAA
ncbi:MAG TPA: NAD(P)/FAD-dependent oxidoreductase [Puia sp.]|jgi:indole-3-pyruvate monooxygenase|nr:NAD(P)/FAD-dependent oxidoreductase [Puia sp.]